MLAPHFCRSLSPVPVPDLSATHMSVNQRRMNHTTAAAFCEHGCIQGLTFRRNFAEISVFFPFPLVTGIRNFGIFRYISFQNSKFNKFRPKSIEIRRNSPKFRNGIPFPPITGILPENEMVNPGPERQRPVDRFQLNMHVKLKHRSSLRFNNSSSNRTPMEGKNSLDGAARKALLLKWRYGIYC